MPRRKRRGGGSEQFILLHRGVTNSLAWNSLSSRSRDLFIKIWTYHNGLNNGQISFSHRQARQYLRAGSEKVTKSFCELIDHGFLIQRQKGSFHVKTGERQGRATEWEITTEDCDAKPAKRLYRKWQANQNAGTTVVTSGNSYSDRRVKKVPWKRGNGNCIGYRK